MFLKKKLSSILSSFEKTISHLELLQEQNVAAIQKNVDAVQKLNDKSNELSTEATKASRVADKLREILK